ncbi:pyroglutamyl-peptidase I [Sporolactobacillus sp. THM7-4]|nr:pyroglutamyl-peptidase I [Sporolactobacillus sp. THM7-4]
MSKKVLMTGFDPFGDEKVNPALEAVDALNEKQVDGVTLKSLHVPTVFSESIKTVTRAIQSWDPDVIICVGQAGGRSRITVERVAINIDDARIPDNESQQPVDVPIIAGGQVAYWSTLPIKTIVQEIKAAGIPAAVSNTAGTFVCNHLFYGVAHFLATEAPNKIGGFIHVPFIPKQVLDKPQPSMALQDIIRGLEIAAVTAARV